MRLQQTIQARQIRQANAVFKSPVKRPNLPTCTGVYFVKWRGYIKIGYASDVINRSRAIGTSIPEGDVEPLAWIPTHDAARHEANIHHALDAFRVRGEWFRDCPDVRRLIERHAMAWPR